MNPRMKALRGRLDTLRGLWEGLDCPEAAADSRTASVALGGALGPVLAWIGTRRLDDVPQEILGAVSRALGPALSGRVRVLDFSDGALTLAAGHPAFRAEAERTRHRMMSELSKAAPGKVSRIDFRLELDSRRDGR